MDEATKEVILVLWLIGMVWIILKARRQGTNNW